MRDAVAKGGARPGTIYLSRSVIDRVRALWRSEENRNERPRLCADGAACDAGGEAPAEATRCVHGTDNELARGKGGGGDYSEGGEDCSGRRSVNWLQWCRERPAAVYRLFDADDRLLYVGCSESVSTRLNAPPLRERLVSRGSPHHCRRVLDAETC